MEAKFTIVPLPQYVFFQEGPGLRKWQWTDSGMKVINVTNILEDGSVDVTNTERHISIEEFGEKYRHFAVEEGDTVVASSGNTYGKVGRINRSHLPLMMNTSVIRFHSADREHLDDDYLFAFLRSPMFHQQVEQFVIGSAQPNFGPIHLKQMKMPLPSIGIQRRIAGIVSPYDELIENNRRRIRILEEMARSIYREWFVDYAAPGVRLRKASSAEREATGKDVFPIGWKLERATDVMIVNPPIQVVKDAKRPFVPMSSLRNDSMLIDSFEYRQGTNGSKFQNRDTLFARITPCLENGKTAYVQFLPTDQVIASGSTEFIVLRAKTVCPEFVYLMARTDEFRNNAIKSMSGATGRQRVQEACFDKFAVAWPGENGLGRFQETVQPMFSGIQVLAKRNENLQRTRDFLLPRLMSGKVNVESLEIATARGLAPRGSRGD